MENYIFSFLNCIAQCSNLIKMKVLEDLHKFFEWGLVLLISNNNNREVPENRIKFEIKHGLNKMS